MGKKGGEYLPAHAHVVEKWKWAVLNIWSETCFLISSTSRMAIMAKDALECMCCVVYLFSFQNSGLQCWLIRHALSDASCICLNSDRNQRWWHLAYLPEDSITATVTEAGMIKLDWSDYYLPSRLGAHSPCVIINKSSTSRSTSLATAPARYAPLWPQNCTWFRNSETNSKCSAWCNGID